MFARWQNVRLKAAEKALRQGRLDEAVAAVQPPEVRTQPRAQKLLDALVEPLIARARLHRQAGRYREALADLDLLQTLGRSSPEATTLRQRIDSEVKQTTERRADEQRAYERAADRLEAGRLETVRLDVQRVDDTRLRDQLAEELDVRLKRGGQLLQQALEALDRGDVLAATRCWNEACQRHGRTQDSDRVAARLATACRDALQRWHEQGRIEGLLAARPVLAELIAHDPALADCDRLCELCSRAAAQLSTADYAGLRQTLLRVKAVRSDVAWVNGALDALARVAEGQELLLASPLGLYASDIGGPAGRRGSAQHAPGAAMTVAALDAGAPTTDALRLDQPLLLLVDGGGSSLLVSRDLVRIGRAGGHVAVEVPLPAELESHHADIVRREADYFLTAYGPAEVNQQPIQHTLLRDGDRLTLGDGAKLAFHRPSAKSESAVLRLSHRCRLAQDVSDVILFRDTCLIGAGPACHVRTREDLGQVVLFERGGALYARQTAGEGHLTASVRPVRSGETLELGGLRVTVKPYADGGRTTDARGS